MKPTLTPQQMSQLGNAEKQDQQQQQRTMPSTMQKAADDKLAKKVGDALKGPSSTSSTMTQKIGQALMNSAEYPFQKPKRDKRPRHPANKGVSANPGFFG